MWTLVASFMGNSPSCSLSGYWENRSLANCQEGNNYISWISETVFVTFILMLAPAPCKNSATRRPVHPAISSLWLDGQFQAAGSLPSKYICFNTKVIQRENYKHWKCKMYNLLQMLALQETLGINGKALKSEVPIQAGALSWQVCGAWCHPGLFVGNSTFLTETIPCYQIVVYPALMPPY